MADRYWVGGSDVWNATAGTKWATTSGGAGGAAAPTSADDVYFDVASGTVNVQIGPSTCKSLNFTGFTGTLNVASTSTLNCYGNLTMIPMTSAWTGNINFLSTTSQTITSNGFTFNNSLNFNGVNGSWQLVDNLTTGSTRTVTLTNGTLDLNNKTLSCGILSASGSGTRTLTAGASGQINLTGSSATIINIGTTTNLTVTNVPTTVNCTYSGSTGTRTITCGGINSQGFLNVNVTAGSDIVTNSGSCRLYSLDFTGFTGTWTNAGTRTSIYQNFNLSSGMTVSSSAVPLEFTGTSGTGTITNSGKTLDMPITFTGLGGTWQFADALTQGSTRAFTVTDGTVKLKAGATSTVGAFATSGSNQKYLQSTTAGSLATLSQASGTVTVSYLSIKDIAATGGATWNAYVDYNNVDQGDNTGWDFSNSPAIDNEFPIALRSFTQPKRF